MIGCHGPLLPCCLCLHVLTCITSMHGHRSESCCMMQDRRITCLPCLPSTPRSTVRGQHLSKIRRRPADGISIMISVDTRIRMGFLCFRWAFPWGPRRESKSRESRDHDRVAGQDACDMKIGISESRTSRAPHSSSTSKGSTSR
jgi:hypothetical protein